ncbi:MAG: hypothetical protein QW371_06090 [Candidatus Bathyarchaeia archaeon]
MIGLPPIEAKREPKKAGPDGFLFSKLKYRPENVERALWGFLNPTSNP